VYRTFRGPVIALLALALALSAPLSADAAKGSRVPPPPDRSNGEFTRSEAQAVLSKAKRQLRPDTRRVRARKPVGNGAETDITMTLRDLYLARSVLTGSDRRAADQMLSRARVFTDGTTDPNTIGTTDSKCSTNFCVHYRPPAPAPAPAGQDATTPTQAQTTLNTLEQVRTFETQTLGYRVPVADTPAVPTIDNPDARFDVFLGDIANEGLYGYCAPDGAQPDTGDGRAAAFCVLDNDYAQSQYGTAPLNSLRVTAAHEFFHAIQFAYDIYEDIWFMEGTATWVEDEAYDAINDNYQYLTYSPIRYPRTAADYTPGLHRYGSFLFFKYAAERFRNRHVVRQFWEQADAPRNRYSLQAIRAVVAARQTSWPAFFSVFASWNSLPNGSYSERARYPRPVLTLTKTLSRKARTTNWRSVNLPHLSSSSIRVAPQARLKPRSKLIVEVNAPDLSHGSTALLQRRYRNGAVSHAMMPLNSSGSGRLQIPFNRKVLASVTIVVSNTSTAMRDCGRIGDSSGGPIYSCYGRGTYDASQIFQVRARLR
jgi:hypothetical protein